MRRVGHLWPRVVAFDNLLSATRRAAAGKRDRAAVARFLERREPEVLDLQRALVEGTWRPGIPTTFTILDPKERTITAAPFRDRVVHHAAVDPLEPVLERRMIPESFACRRGKGTHRAVAHAQRQLRRHEWFLKMDIAQCFASMDHEVVLGTLARVIKDQRVLELWRTIVAGPGAAPAPSPARHPRPCGLPIGHLTSQWLANLTLDRLDHFVKEDLRIPGYARYMDDFVLFADDKACLRDAHAQVVEFLQQHLRLREKARATLLAPAHAGLPFLGWTLYRGTLRLRPANRQRSLRRLQARRGQFRAGHITLDTLAAAELSVLEHLRHGATLPLRRRWCATAAVEEESAMP